MPSSLQPLETVQIPISFSRAGFSMQSDTTTCRDTRAHHHPVHAHMQQNKESKENLDPPPKPMSRANLAPAKTQKKNKKFIQ